ncbi:hypothetical protein PHYBLDRAFT_147715 [Phycomyces blakesleeanus NRRL 1555(-)]|uniref:Uncharacterized protein n=1 Tax=Phycomyces blakesleeanus (strain ATCC 8743b / DSM 1359 / FGSC 10004 / NBRC 33097 / NRRL 1555) TaxID=763407 RepID=A0A163DHB0_PHYB8|nr:hypothetical protein PHYBLDRAFT_147674 [Phycomyces blakesleeanus NRRL 1555(-)]XP_018289250.1 hypothetical protein PHYBLDRAFT_147715 [Phycomyces blakesleeanus NRRL 1555(-)]OAD71166.1 hypothetical protein PHYBLDRAFT_147674 [Phycomyces blakesleeanus NRRL 1555(-)]OAD71210.1 hypothetical protein PHYBLDRAFT_147715 [Phycomyces blakesleeanus NRRL 1555(-)]|eukprot:XP_018289206.1 hypothetical protein PHYBLDRAFT_147674 [Phycomyces blakesleeanus NRRL 1555(-)]
MSFCKLMVIGRPSWLLCTNDDQPETDQCITRNLPLSHPVGAASIKKRKEGSMDL